MASAASAFVEFIRQPPTIIISAGIAIVRHTSAGCCVERAMSVRNLEQSVERAKAALARYAAGETDVVVDD